ncbi:hypothetical protein P43SY_007872 [Pythium insidiosum]|uniref:Uncharacterized protein n=1 Tax=Pythium insidiosum TaxID=114742 RepID=A0AAD5QBJ2_PYTIN|nr:hypothetical protein P43SY_007872 [Pythium insidiosum]
MWATRVLRMAVRKTTTGIVGLPVNVNARQDLIAIYNKTLQAAQVTHASATGSVGSGGPRLTGLAHRPPQTLPEGIAYRKAVEQITNYRLKVVMENEDEDTIEKVINCGQLEELIEQAEDELSVIPMYLEHKLWEPPVKAE